ncbi:MAG: hypothetical protein PSX80_12990 [bacterium]|nr:hypothetical protein [bacterium]
MPLILGGTVAGVLGVFIILGAVFSKVSPPVVPAPVPVAESTTVQAERATRRTAAATMQIEYSKTLKPLTMSSTGDRDETLFVSSPMVNDKWVAAFRKSRFNQLRTSGFQWVKITDGKKEWIERP